MEKVLVVGATGSTGKKVVNLLNKSDAYTPIAMVRKESQINQFESKGIQTRFGDLKNDISQIAKGVDKIIFAAGSGGKAVVEVDQEGAKKMINEGKSADISKFVMLSSMGADAPEKAKDLKPYLKAKHNADEYLRASLLPYSIVRPGTLTNNAGSGKIIASKNIGVKGEISRDDVAKALVSALNNNRARDTTFEILKGASNIDEALERI